MIKLLILLWLFVTVNTLEVNNSNQWLGVTVKSEKPGGKVAVCLLLKLCMVFENLYMKFVCLQEVSPSILSFLYRVNCSIFANAE